ncbi:unnamed protein product [Allacma fusca]|uniref:Ion transport domain-containing protein n=1 Tax=Allacma fusca TaxID=39272 RepID=A0A8J2K6S3_9HEXA|nr:unnamed protein product [Allacma fusca]
MNQLLWYYAELERKRCDKIYNNTNDERPPESCHLSRRFSNLFETSQTLFWAVFGLIELESFELAGIKSFTRFWGMLMFGCFSVINIVVLLNLLIAMMNHSYQLIFEKADVEWKFARSKLWISYFEEGATVPPPFNIIPTPKTFYYMLQWFFRKFCRYSVAAKREHIKTVRRKHQQQSERDFRYQNIMRNLVRRYVTTEQRQADNQGVTEDDVNEIKQDISAFRCELLEVLKNSGMNTTSVTGLGQGSGGKKNRQRERRLMKGFNIAPAPPSNTTPILSEVQEVDTLQENETVHYDKKSPKTRLARLARMAGAKREMSKKKWGTIIEAARNAGMSKLVGRSRSEDSVCSNCSQGSASVIRKFRQQSTLEPGGSISSVVREGSTTSSIGKKKRERFARSRSGIQLPISMHLARFKFRDSGKASNSGISQSLDAGDTSEINESFDELRVKRTVSAPTRDGSSTPSGTFTTSTTTTDVTSAKSSQKPELVERGGGVDSGGRPHSSYVCVQLDDDCDRENRGGNPVKPNGANTPTSSASTSVGASETKLKGIVQPLRTSTGWL